MSDVITNSKTKVYIGGVTAGQTQADYEAVAPWTRIGDVKGIDKLSDETAIVAVRVLGENRPRKAKGSTDTGDVSITVVRLADDAGQVLMRSAASSDQKFDFKVELIDGTVIYFTGLVAKVERSYGETDDVLTEAYTVAVTAAPLEIAA